MPRPLHVAVAGATGAVGVEMIKTLERRNFPVASLKLLASARSAGRKMTFRGEEIAVEEMTEASFKGVDVALFSAGAGVSKQFRQAVVDAGAVMVDNTSAFRLEDERPGSPMMVGTASLPEGSTRSCRVTLRPMLARITLRSVACDFTGRSYAGEKLTDVRAYLTYANRECHPLDTADRPASWLNAGRLNEAETAGLAHPELVFAQVGDALGGRIYPKLDFYCYPNPSDGTVFGQPVTRLVLEGKLRGTTYYYPIDLPGLQADVQYTLDITLTRTGTSDPDIPAVSGTILLESDVMDWDERDWDDIHYR